MWFMIRVAEILDHMQSWRVSGIVVDELYHWPWDINIADLPTRARPTLMRFRRFLNGRMDP
jgi:hypothetical protein